VLYTFFQLVEKRLIEILLRIVYISESIPFAQISDKKISFLQLILLLLFIYSFTRFLFSRHARPLITSLAALLLFQFTVTHKNLTRPAPQLTVFNSPGQSEIAIFHNNKRHFTEIPENSFISHLKSGFSCYRMRISLLIIRINNSPLDILILSQQASFDIEQLLACFVLEDCLRQFTTPLCGRQNSTRV
jgi:competence protein ComEC